MTHVAVREILAPSPELEVAARGFSHLLEDDLIRLAVEAAERGDCPVAISDIGKTVSDAREVEKGLQDKGYADPATAIQIQPIPVDLVIDGVVGASYGEVDYLLQISNAKTGALVGEIKGSIPQDGLSEQTAGVAQQLLDQICPKKKAWHLTAHYNDLSLDELICDLGKPFSARGLGQAAGIVFRFTPAGPSGGSFSVGGTAAGVLWSGGGTYSVAVDGDSGTMPIVGSWQITTPAGVFGDSGTIPGRLAKAPSCTADAKPKN